MAWPMVGVNLPKNCTYNALDETLFQLEREGFDGVEINIETFPMIVGGVVCQPWVDAVKQVLEKHPLFYSAHIGRGLNLRDLEQPALHRAVLASSLEICKQLDMSVLVLHYEVKTQNQMVEQQFLEAHRWAADLAGRLGVVICVENIEVELVEPVVELAMKVDHPHLKLNLDTGHAFLAANYFHFDFLLAVKQMAPYLGHMHLNDNTGTFEPLRITNRVAYDSMSMSLRREFGRGDIHIPPFFGTLPFDEVFHLTKGYQGRYICEYTYQDYEPFNASVVQRVKERLAVSRQF